MMKKSRPEWFSMGLVVRTIRKEDMDDIIEIVKKAKRDFIYGYLYYAENYDKEAIWWRVGGTRNFPTLVADLDGKVVGFAVYYEHWSEDDNLYLEFLVTHPDYRGRGIGSALIHKLFDIAVEKGYDVLSLHTWGSNPAYRLYRRKGFCLISNTFFYMINFLPQLFKHLDIRKIFDPPHKILKCLAKPAEKINCKGHLLNRYEINCGDLVEAVFHESSRKLLSISFRDTRISVEPPVMRTYFDDETVKVKILASKTLPVVIDDKPRLVRENEESSFSIKAKKSINLKIGELTFGFKLDVKPRVGIGVLEKVRWGDRVFAKVMISNNDEKPIKNILRILPADNVLMGNNVVVLVPPKDSKILNIVAEKVDSITVLFGGAKKVIKFEGYELEPIDEEFVSAYWVVSDEEVYRKIYPKLGFYYQFNILGYEPDFDIKGQLYSYENEDLLVRLKPELKGQDLRLVVEVLPKKDMEDYISVHFWIRHTVDLKDQLILPVSNDKAVVVPLNPMFPRWYSIIRESIPGSWVAIRSDRTALILDYPQDYSFTIASTNSFILSKKVALKSGEKETLILNLAIRNIGDIERLYKVEEPIAVETLEDQLILQNNWPGRIKLGVKIDRDLNLELRRDEKRIVELTPFFGLKKIKIDLFGLINTLYLYGVKKDILKEKEYLGEELRVQLSDDCGGPNEYAVGGRNIIYWSSELKEHPLTSKPTRGGWIIIMRKDKVYDLGVAKWGFVPPNKYVYSANGIKLERSWLIIPDKGILEKLAIKNESSSPKEFSIIEYVFLSERIRKIKRGAVTLEGDTLWFETQKYVGIETEDTNLYFIIKQAHHPHLRETITVEKPLKSINAIGAIANVRIHPKQTIETWRLLTHDKKTHNIFKRINHILEF